MSTPKPNTPELIFFQEVKTGDIAKHKNQSNLSPTGGGARDLRIPHKFRPVLEQFFPNVIGKSAVRDGKIHWEEQSSVREATVKFWPPDNARPKEDRIAKISRIGGWAIDESEWKRDLAKGKRWFFLLVKDKDGIVWARLLYESNLANEDPRVRRYVEQRIRSRKGNVSVRGSINFRTGEEFP